MMPPPNPAFEDDTQVVFCGGANTYGRAKRWGSSKNMKYVHVRIEEFENQCWELVPAEATWGRVEVSLTTEQLDFVTRALRDWEAAQEILSSAPRVGVNNEL